KANSVAASLMTIIAPIVKPRTDFTPARREDGSHIVVALVVEDEGPEQSDGFAAGSRWPKGGGDRLRREVPEHVNVRIGAVAGVLDDVDLGDVDIRRSICVAVTGHDAATLDREVAESQLALPDVGRLLLEVDGGEHCVGDALAGMGDRHACIGFGLAGGT